MQNMGNWFSSETQASTRTVRTNMSVNEKNPKVCVLIYTVNEARRENCTLTWENDGNDQYIARMRAVDRDTEYIHNSMPIPGGIYSALKPKGPQKDGHLVMFDIHHDGKVSLARYFR